MGIMKCPKCEDGWCYPCEYGDNYGTGVSWQCDNCGYEFNEYWIFDEMI
ncbi:MAG: hypothetical protein ACFFDH_24840 [Promethearchaeota archaeon]